MYLGVFFNLGLLGYYKYTGFILQSFEQITGLSTSVDLIVLPLAISFFSFQQIAYIVDLRRGEEREYSFVEYILFVSFFPQLIAGPIVHHAEMMPQFNNIKNNKLKPSYKISFGLSLFVIGLFKKVVIADSLAVFANPIFSAAVPLTGFSFVESWLGALSYTFQLYFDFSGYSDMAIGIAACFGILIPINFNSPYKALNIINFWRRWHMTLSRFLRDYLYISFGGNRNGEVRRYLNVLLTMLLGGLWHGASWLFVIWGGLHGVYLIVNHLWSKAVGHKFQSYVFYRYMAQALTFFSVVIAWVVFRAQSLHSSSELIEAMLGRNGISLPQQYLRFFPEVGVSTFNFEVMPYYFGVKSVLLIVMAFLISFFLPNSGEVMNAAVKYSSSKIGFLFNWRENYYWLIIILSLSIASFYYLGRMSEFLYFQF